MARNAKTLRRNNKEQKEILIGPSMAPRFFDSEGFPQSVSGNNLKSESASVQISRPGWQADFRSYKSSTLTRV